MDSRIRFNRTTGIKTYLSKEKRVEILWSVEKSTE